LATAVHFEHPLSSNDRLIRDMEPSSVELAGRLRQKESAAEEEVYGRYVDRLIALARQRLSRKLSRRIDPEDVVQSAYRSFFIRLREGQYTIERSGDLWRLLAQITLHKLYGQAEHHRAAKRSTLREESSPTNDAGNKPPEPLARDPSVQDVLAATEELERLMSQLTPAQRRTVELRMQDHTIEEIATTLHRSERTIRRWLDIARAILEQSWITACTDDTSAPAPSAGGL
jgi:RNA polymerase sigma factor (sigma-70 family)